jgi:hypothetical protein
MGYCSRIFSADSRFLLLGTFQFSVTLTSSLCVVPQQYPRHGAMSQQYLFGVFCVLRVQILPRLSNLAKLSDNIRRITFVSSSSNSSAISFGESLLKTLSRKSSSSSRISAVSHYLFKDICISLKSNSSRILLNVWCMSFNRLPTAGGLDGCSNS